MKIKKACERCGKYMYVWPSDVGRYCSFKCNATRHGHNSRSFRSRANKAWDGMIQRCTNPSCKSYARYGAVGISVCDRWRSFENFLSDMGECPDSLTLDRINNNGNYEPGNCRWVSMAVQAKNRKTNVWMVAFGERKIAEDWARDSRCKVSSASLLQRIHAGWDAERAISTPRTDKTWRRTSHEATAR